MQVSMDMSGMDAIIAKLDSVVADQTIRIDQAVQGAGIDTAADAKKACPVKTGRLRSSIQYKKVGLCECQVGTNVKYALPVEAGHVTRSGSFVAARPYLYPSFIKNSQKLLEECQSIIGG